MMPSETVWPRSGWATMRASAITAAGMSGMSISRNEARSMRRVASRCAPQIANAILVSSEGCMESPATTNQPRVPLDSCPMPGMSTSTSSTIVMANAENAVRRRKDTDTRRANQKPKRPTTVHSTWRPKIAHGEPSSS